MNKKEKKGLLTSLKKLEKQAILDALRITKGNISQTAQALSMSRTTLHQKLQKYRIKKEKL